MYGEMSDGFMEDFIVIVDFCVADPTTGKTVTFRLYRLLVIVIVILFFIKKTPQLLRSWGIMAGLIKRAESFITERLSILSI